MKRLLCSVAPAVAALLTLTDAAHAESGYRPPFQPGNLYGAPMCTFIPDNPQSAPTPAICILRSDNGTYAVRAGERDRCRPYNCGELIQQWKIRPDAATGSVTCAFMYDRNVCHTPVEWREETDRLCRRCQRRHRQKAGDAASWLGNERYVSAARRRVQCRRRR